MKQKLTSEGRSQLQRQLCSASHFICPDEQIIEQILLAKAVYFWAGTAMEFSYARELMRRGIAAMQPEPGWETEDVALMVIASDSAELSFILVEELTDMVQSGLPCRMLTFGSAFAEPGIGELQLVLAASEAPVRAPERLIRLTMGTLTILAGGTRPERESLMDEFQLARDFARELSAGAAEEPPDGLGQSCLALSEYQEIDGQEPASQRLSELLLDRFHSDRPTVLAMQYIPKSLAKWFPPERMKQEPVELPFPE